MKPIRRQVTLLCPTCGKSEFASNNIGGDAELLTGGSCGRELRRDELESYNAEAIEAAKNDMAKEMTREVGKMVQQSLRDAFRGNKFIKIK